MIEKTTWSSHTQSKSSMHNLEPIPSILLQGSPPPLHQARTNKQNTLRFLHFKQQHLLHGEASDQNAKRLPKMKKKHKCENHNKNYKSRFESKGKKFFNYTLPCPLPTLLNWAIYSEIFLMASTWIKMWTNNFDHLRAQYNVINKNRCNKHFILNK